MGVENLYFSFIGFRGRVFSRKKRLFFLVFFSLFMRIFLEFGYGFEEVAVLFCMWVILVYSNFLDEKFNIYKVRVFFFNLFFKV